MKTKTVRFMMLIAMLFSLLMPVTPAEARAEVASSKGVSPAGMLNSDGTLNLDEVFNGALDLSGYSVEIDPVRGPVFGAERSGVFPSALTSAAWDGMGSSGGMLNGTVMAIAVNGTDVYIGGAFTNANGIAAADYIVKWNSATDTWSALSSNGAGNGSLNGTVNSIVIQGNGNVYVGGEFTNVNNSGASLTAADYIARWNGANWFSVSGNGFSNGSLNDYVNVMTFDDSGNLYVGGGFFNVNNAGNVLNAADYVAKWNGAQWSALGSNGAGDGSLNASVIALETIGNDIYVGGVFLDVNNASTVLYSADRIAKWDGNNWSPLNRNGAGNGSINGWVMALAVSGTDLYVGGTFTDVDDNGNILSAADYVAKWDGTQWSALGSDGSGNGTLNDMVYTLAVDEQGILYAGGEFIDIAIGGFNLNTADYIAKWNGTGWSALGNNGSGNGSLNNHVIDLAVSGTAIYAGGQFINVTSNGVVMLEADYIAVYGTSPSVAIFADVPLDYWSNSYIERLYNAGITGGCTAVPLNYCPTNQVTRAQMAIFLLRGMHGSAYAPPAATGTIFTDVPLGTFAAAWIEQLATEGITSGCGGGNYCPNQTVSRAQMAIFLVRAKHGIAFVPPTATGIFPDVPVGSFGANYIEQLVTDAVTSGCGGGNYCPNTTVKRDSMAVFLVKAFNLP